MLECFNVDLSQLTFVSDSLNIRYLHYFPINLSLQYLEYTKMCSLSEFFLRSFIFALQILNIQKSFIFYAFSFVLYLHYFSSNLSLHYLEHTKTAKKLKLASM